jgi:hypothetical protein
MQFMRNNNLSVLHTSLVSNTLNGDSNISCKNIIVHNPIGGNQFKAISDSTGDDPAEIVFSRIITWW